LYKFLGVILLLSQILFSQNITSLLEEIESTSEKSLSTVDEKIGHVSVYSKEDLRRMQYTTISDLLKEFPLSNLNKNRFGATSLSISGSKTDISGFFRIFINDHEISSSYTLAPSGAWMKLPIDLVEYIEVYRSDSSFSLGSDNGVFFIRIYTKNPLKENATSVFGTVSDNGSNSQAISYADTLENGWSFFTYLHNTHSNDSTKYKTNTLQNDSLSQYMYLNIKKEGTAFNFGFTQGKKDNYLGYALDAVPDSGETAVRDYFLDISSYLLDDNSLKVKVSYDVNKLRYEETNKEGLGLIPTIDLSNIPGTIPTKIIFDSSVKKSSFLLSKKMTHKNNNFLLGINYQQKKYTTLKNSLGKFKEFDEEQMYSLFMQDDYQLNDDFLLVLNAKFDKYKRDGGLSSFNDTQYRAGFVYRGSESFGLKSFYSKTYLTPSFFNIDNAKKSSPALKNQDYKVYSVEGVYLKDESKFSLLYTNVGIENFIYFAPIGFINVAHTLKVENLIMDYVYEFSKNEQIILNYFFTKLNDKTNNSYRGGYVKFVGEYDNLSYFSSLIYRNAYTYYDLSVSESYNFNLGLTYTFKENISFALKGENLFDNSTKSLYKEGFPGNDFSLEDYDRELTLSMKWVF